MKRGRAFDDLPTPISAFPSVTEGLAETLRRLVDLTGATAGAVALRPRDQEPIVQRAAPESRVSCRRARPGAGRRRF